MDETPDLFEWAEQQRKTVEASECAAPSAVEENIEICDNRPVVLIDALSQIFRSFYAIRQLNNHRGEPVNALYLMTKLLLQMEKDHSGCRGALLFDSGKVAFRLELLPEYKGTAITEESVLPLRCRLPGWKGPCNPDPYNQGPTFPDHPTSFHPQRKN